MTTNKKIPATFQVVTTPIKKKKLFTEYAERHAVKIYGELSHQLREMLDSLKDVDIKRYSFLKGFEPEVTPEWQSLKA